MVSIKKAFTRHKKYLNDLTENEYKESFDILYRCTKSNKLRDFQFRLLHMAIITNKELIIFGLQVSETCTFCRNSREDTYHLILHCPVSQKVWSLLNSFLQEKTGISIKFSDKEIVLGSNNFPFYHLYNHIMLITKQYLYACRCLNLLPEFEVLKIKIERERQIEMAIARQKNKMQKCLIKWNPLINNLDY